MKYFLRLFIYLIAISLAFPASAEDSREQAISKVETYLSGLTTIVADFIQIAPDGSMVSGKFFLARPGKMRWQYDPPTPILMIANKKFLTFYDYELDQISNIPLESTLAGFLARDTIKFGTDVSVTDLKQGPGSLRVKVIQAKRPDDGTLTLEFSTNPMQLRNMIVVDAQGLETTVSLNNARYGQKLDNELFIFKNPRLKAPVGDKARGIER